MQRVLFIALASVSLLACGGSADVETQDQDRAGTTREADSLTQPPPVPQASTDPLFVPLPRDSKFCGGCHENRDMTGVLPPPSHWPRLP